MDKLVMNRIRRTALVFLLALCFAPATVEAQVSDALAYDDLGTLSGEELQGAFIGMSNNALVCLGGKDITGRMQDAIYVRPSGKSDWQRSPRTLPTPLGFGAAFSVGGRIILVGGTDGVRHLQSVYTVTWKDGEIHIDTLISLPFPLAYLTGAPVGDHLFIAGGAEAPAGAATKAFLALDLRGGSGDWTVLESWPGAARTHAVGGAMQGKFYIWGGRQVGIEGISEHKRLRDGYAFTPFLVDGELVGGTWQTLEPSPVTLADGPGPTATLGLSHMIFPVQGEAEMAGYNVEADSWSRYASPDAWQAEGYSAVDIGGKWVFLPQGGRVETGIVAVSKATSFGVLNWIMLVVYLAAMLWIGFIHDRKDAQTTRNFFTAEGRIPWWAAGLSIYGTQLSAITFMAIPALVFATDWSLAIGSLLILATVPIVVKYYVPYFRKVSVTSAYEYLEHRFSRVVRSLASLSFILFQLGRMGVVLYLPAVAIASVTESNIYVLIVIMGIICLVYTVMGGIEAVIWTDFAQVIVLMGGAIVCLWVAISQVDGGLGSILTQGIADGKFTLAHWGWTADRPVFWVYVVGFFFLNLIPYTSDQTLVQRYLTVSDEKQVARSLWTNAWVTMPGTVIFFGLGTVMYYFYKENPGIIASDKVDEILPYFVVHQLPAGVAGLVIAGVFAASQSTLSSSMNSISASFVSDLYRGQRRPATSLRVARVVTVVAGLLGTGSAMAIALLDVQFIFDLFQEILGILGGSLAGVFMLGVFTKRANAAGVISGLLGGAAVVWGVKMHTDISVYLYGAISVMSSVLIGYIVSLMLPGGRKGVVRDEVSDVRSSS